MALGPQTVVDSVTSGALYGLVGLGYTLVFRVLRTVNFAHAGEFMLGTMAALTVSQALGLQTGGSGLSNVPQAIGITAICLLAAIAIGAVFAVVVELIGFMPLRRKRSDRIAGLIVGLAALIVIQEIAQIWRGPAQEAFPALFPKMVVLGSKAGFQIRLDQLLIVAGSLVTFALVDMVYNHTRFGRAIRATAENRRVASLMGINVDRTILLSFAIAGATAGVAAVLFLIDFEFTYFNIGFDIGLKGFTAAVLGGMGNLRGALVGGVSLGLIEGIGAGIFGSEWSDVIAFSLLVLVLTIRPNGILRGEGAVEGVRM